MCCRCKSADWTLSPPSQKTEKGNLFKLEMKKDVFCYVKGALYICTDTEEKQTKNHTHYFISNGIENEPLSFLQ